MARIGYVVVEYNQASRQPAIVYGAELHDYKTEAELDRLNYEQSTAAVGRRERYVVAAVEIGEDE